jgi:N-acetylglucosaminyldiphosphoundecaprenol N-acetyl-beta-D-mannosaminyltransferase
MADVLQTSSIGSARESAREVRRLRGLRANFARRRISRAAAEAVRRGADIFAAVSALSLLSVVVLPLLVWRACYGWPLRTVAQLGKRRRLFHSYRIELGPSRFAEWLRRRNIDRSLVWLNVLAGQMTLVGPRAVAVDEPGLSEAGGRRFWVKPGLVCLWWIRQRANIAFGSVWAADNEYVASRSLRGDVGILLRAIVAGLYGSRRGEIAERIELFDLPIANISMDEAVRRMVAQLDVTEPRRVCFVNADCVNLSFRNDAYRACLRDSWMNLADGIGMKLAGRVFGRDIRENICGTDLFLFLNEALAGTQRTLYLLGAKPGVVDDLIAWMRVRYPETRVAGSRHGYFTVEEEPQVIADIKASGADVLLVAFGAPRQDLWVAENLAATGVKLAMGVGGLFDYYSGRIPRAPQWVREIGMEWAFRLAQEPRRLWRRYVVGNVVFLARLGWWKLRGMRGAGRGARDSAFNIQDSSKSPSHS